MVTLLPRRPHRLGPTHLRLLAEAVEIEHRSRSLVDARRELTRRVRQWQTAADVATLAITILAAVLITMVAVSS